MDNAPYCFLRPPEKKLGPSTAQEKAKMGPCKLQKKPDMTKESAYLERCAAWRTRNAFALLWGNANACKKSFTFCGGFSHTKVEVEAARV